MKIKIIALISLVVFLGLSGCASMDLEVTETPLHSEFGELEPRVPADSCIYKKESQVDDKEYMVLAEYIVQERINVSKSWSPTEMACHAFEDAREKGADAIIIEDVDTKNVPQRARTSSVVKLKAVRFHGDPPE